MAFDFNRLRIELEDLKKSVTASTDAKAALAKADEEKTASEKAFQDATVASQVADQLVVKQVDFLIALLKQEENPGDDPTPNAPETPPTPTV